MLSAKIQYASADLPIKARNYPETIQKAKKRNMQVKCHRTISALMSTKRLKAFHPWGKMLYPCIYLYSGCYGFSSVPTGLSALPAPLHSDALPLVGLDCTGEHVQLVSEHSSFCLGNDTLKKHLHENAIKSFFRWIVQAVFGDDSRKCSVKATQYGMDRGWGTEVGRSMPTALSI